MSDDSTRGQSTPPQSVCERALHILEVQDHIFGFCEAEDAAHCAVVCKAWKEMALNRAWHTVFDIQNLFSLLGPLTFSRSSDTVEYKLKCNVKAADRARFLSYAARVRALVVSSECECPSDSAMVEMLRAREGTSLLPNLRRLTIYIYRNPRFYKVATAFMHPGVLDMKVYCNTATRDMPSTQSFLEEITAWAPNLRTLEILVRSKQQESLLTCVSQLLLGQKSLQKLFIPPALASNSVLGSASRLPQLEQIAIVRETFTTIRDDVDILDAFQTGPPHDESCFPSIQAFDLRVPLPTATQLISGHPSFTRLVSLKILVSAGYNPSDVRECLEVVSQTCQNMEALEITHSPSDHSGLGEPLVKADLSSIPRFQSLQRFLLTHAHAIALSNADLLDLLKDSRPLVELRIAPCKGAASCAISPAFTLDVLHEIARYQPTLEHLSLCFEVLLADPDSIPFLHDQGIRPFKRMQSLDVRKSRVEDANRTALYLSQVLPPGCAIEYSGGMCGPLWESVTKNIHLFEDVAAQHRKRVEALESEIKSLKATLQASAAPTENEGSG